MLKTVIDDLHVALSQQYNLLQAGVLSGEFSITDLLEVDRNFSKYLIISSASFFEVSLKQIILDFANRASKNNVGVYKLINDKIIARGYHGLLDWKVKEPRIASFFCVFGVDWASVETSFTDYDYPLGYKEFVYLGNARNIMVHGNLAAASTSYSLSDSYKKYKSAQKFLDIVPLVLNTSLDPSLLS